MTNCSDSKLRLHPKLKNNDKEHIQTCIRKTRYDKKINGRFVSPTALRTAAP